MNHMAAIDESTGGNRYLLIHCGSRSLGVKVAEHYTDKALNAMEARKDDAYQMYKDEIADLREQGRTSEINVVIEEMKCALQKFENKDFAYVSGEDMADYLNDVHEVVQWTRLNHDAIFRKVADSMEWDLEEYGLVNTCVHNYVDIYDRVIRKGSISAHDGQLGIIPLNMRDGTLVVRGLGNEDWNCSLPHGAGRLMSRSEARKNIDLDEYVDSMKDVYSTTVNFGSLDEAPMAYNDCREIIEAIQPNAVIVDHLREIYNYKDDTKI